MSSFGCSYVGKGLDLESVFVVRLRVRLKIRLTRMTSDIYTHLQVDG